MLCCGQPDLAACSEQFRASGFSARRAGTAGGCQGRTSRCGLLSFPCWSSCRSEQGCVKGVSWWLFARLLVDLHHLLGWACQLAHPLGKFQEAYHNLTRNLSSSINLLVSPCLLPERSPAHLPPQPCSAACQSFV